MITDLGDEALEYGRTARRAFGAAGGDELARDAEEVGDRSGGAAAKVLAELGAWDLDPRASTEELEAAAALCRNAGWWAVPHPVAERLARPHDLDVDGLVVIADHGRVATVAGTDLRWAAVTLDGRRSLALPEPLDRPPRTSGFVSALWLKPVDEAGDAGAVDVALALVLPCWTLLGMLDRALDLTAGYVQARQQFGQPLASFQGVQFQLTDAEVERVGLDELAKHALWSVQTRRPDALHDALALRLAAIEAAETVFRISHQLHGAIGFCDETTLSWLSRASQPLRRLPLGLSATRAALTERLGRHGLAGLFDQPPVSGDL